ncbi:hypothetical protein [Carboxylicivirga sp. M1479]|uniref:golvesin C-terminal-like domain-containing protein n=1 Tax=Carboxylicivirga sp. M1479 TaxID=2594476 RepID=UPI001177BC5D|nr:hypothetical protein [Carboxylicivirga sp. M1479]TRX70425.1 hypothetical protein FNN09_11940 [Carboxylicivirga sp. M1479]
MMSLFKITTVARFESKTLLRSWFFRIFAILIMGFVLMFNLFGVTAIADGGWPGRLLPSGVPYFNLWILNIAQAVIAVFLSADFLGRDKKLDTTEAFYVRSMSNSEYVLGKTMGVLKVFLLLNAAVLMSALLFSLIATEVNISWTAYLLYPLLISLPTLILVLGLSFFTMTLVRNQAITFVLLLGFIALSLFYLGNKYLGVFDILGFYTPFMRSDFTGFQDFNSLLIQRFAYLLIGMALIIATILRLPRLEQQRLNKPMLWGTLLIFSSLIAVSYFIQITTSIRSDNLLLQINQLNAKLPQIASQITSYQAKVKHNNDAIDCEVSMQINRNAYTANTLPLALNPGLKVTACTINQQPVSFQQDAHIVSVDVTTVSEESYLLQLTYEGTILDDAIYADIKEEIKASENRKDPLLAGKGYSFIQPNYVLLTREAHWYPVIARDQYWTQYPFAAMNLTVHSEPNLEVISQGLKDSINSGTYSFTPEQKLNAYSLVIGDYERHTTVIDSVEFNLYHHKTHTYYKDYFSELNDTVADVVQSIKDDFERKLGLTYPFQRLSIVEAPINFHSYIRNWTLATENIMPEMVFFPENGGGLWQNDLGNVRRRIDRSVDRSNEERSEKELQVEVLKNYLGDNFIRPSRFFFGRQREAERSIENWGRYQIFPLYYSYVNSIDEQGYPLLTIAVENYLHQRLGETRRRGLGGLSSNDEVVLKLRNNSLKDLINEEDVNTLGNIFASKGNQLFSNLKVNVGQANFDNDLNALMTAKQFQNQAINDFTASISQVSMSDFSDMYNSWLNDAYRPAFLFSSVDVSEIKEGNRIRYFVKVTVSNQGDADGIVGFTVREGRQQRGRGRFRSRFQGDDEQDGEQSYQFNAGQTYDIGFLLDEEPREVLVNTYIAVNIPSSQTLTLNPINRKNKKVAFFEGSKISSKTLNYKVKNEIIVDNEDSGFELVNTGESRTVKDWWTAMQNEEDGDSDYGMVRFWNPPVKWQPVVSDKFFGEYLRSAVYKRKGSGEGYLAWKANIEQAGTYEVHAYVANITNRFRRGNNNSNKEKIYNFTVYHDDGKDPIELVISNDNSGWLYLGEFYFSEGNAQVQLSDVSNSEYIIGDAVKWIKK